MNHINIHTNLILFINFFFFYDLKDLLFLVLDIHLSSKLSVKTLPTIQINGFTKFGFKANGLGWRTSHRASIQTCAMTSRQPCLLTYRWSGISPLKSPTPSTRAWSTAVKEIVRNFTPKQKSALKNNQCETGSRSWFDLFSLYYFTYFLAWNH